MKYQQYISIAVILETHGLRGNVKIKKFAKDIEITLSLNLYVKNDNNIFENIEIKQINKKSDLYILKIKSIESIEQAQKYLKKPIYCKKSDLILAENEFFKDELIGLQVEDKAKNLLGTIINIYNFGASDVIEIESNEGKLMIPFTKKTFPEIDLSKSTITMIKN